MVSLPELLSIVGASRALNVSETTVRRLIDRKELKAIRVGGQWRIDTVVIQRYLDRDV